MRPLKIFTFIVAMVVALVAVGSFVGGAALTWLHATQRDADGFVTSPRYDLATPAYAIVTETFEFAERPGDWLPRDVGTVRVALTSVDEVFVGIGDREAVEAYLATVQFDRVTDLGVESDDVTYRMIPGGAPAALPGNQSFWSVTTIGSGDQLLSWDPGAGDWTAIVMNADGAAGVELTAQVGVDVGSLLLGVGIALIVGGLLLGALAAAGLVWSTRAEAVDPATPPATARPATTSPVRLSGTLEPGLSRWMWLVKWILAIPHIVVLAFLWAAYAVLTVVAFFAILFTGRYPRGIFDFNVGVIRWSWRVGFYANGALATDRYPPFSLRDADYPARFDVVYPERLSRGLVLVKWWLLAIPHYLVVGLFTSGLIWWTTQIDGNTVLEIGGGLIGLLVLIAGFALAFTGRYPESLFDLIVGLNRWVFRVVAYAGLMTDEYPPFRLDLGGEEPGPNGSAPPGVPPTGAPSREPVLTG